MGLFNKIKKSLKSKPEESDSETKTSLESNPKENESETKTSLESKPDENESEIQTSTQSNQNEKNFRYLSDLIKDNLNTDIMDKSEREIILDADIIIEDNEIDEYSQGIEIIHDNLVIDGKGHVIDGRNKISLFDIRAKGITLKNIVFKDGYKEFGSCVHIGKDFSAKVIDCEFIGDSELFSDAIKNYSKISIENCRFDVKSKDGSPYAVLMNSPHSTCHIGNCSLNNAILNNHGFLYLRENEIDHLESHIKNDRGQVIILTENPQQANISDSFHHLIHKEMEITLHEDLILDEKSIILDADNLIIDGNNHTISSNHDLGIFKILADNITLRNIVFKDSHVQRISGGAIENIGLNLSIENCIFENNSSPWDGGAIDNEGSLSVENSIFKNNSAKSGGAISNEGELNIIDCEFITNQSEVGGGCIHAQRIVNIENSTFKDNFSEYAGCISIYNTSTVNIKDSAFINSVQSEKGMVATDNCDLNLINSQFLNDGQSGGISARNSKLNVEECRFEGNLKALDATESDVTVAQTTFINNTETIFSDTYLNIQKCEFRENDKSEFTIRLEGNEDSSSIIENNTFDCESSKTIHLSGGYCISKNNTFNIRDNPLPSNENGEIESNYAIYNEDGEIEGTYAIYNEDGEIEIKNERFNNASSKVIYNNNILKTTDSIENLIENGPDSKLKPLMEELPGEYKGFGYLEELINENDEINLEYDILLHEGEKDFFEGGIEICRDNLKINGNGHVIDAGEFSRIFYILSSNVTLENITFKNGKYFKSNLDDETCGGGAISILHNASLTLINCRFVDNSSRQSSGAIKSNGDNLTAIDCEFINNIAHNGNSGAIYNKMGDLTLKHCIFNSNHSEGFGGAVYNKDGTLDISFCQFSDNYVKEGFFVELRGGAVYNEMGKLNVMNSNFKGNKCFRGGAIFNAGDLFDIRYSKFSANEAEEGASIYNLNESVFRFYHCTFENNDSQGAGIYNKDSMLYLDECKFINNLAKQNGGAIYNDKGEINLKSCDFESNRAIWGKCGGAISSFYGTLNIEDCNFHNNSARNGGVIDIYAGKWFIANCNFHENSSDWKGGAIVNTEDGYLKMENCRFVNNKVFKSGTDIYNLKGEIELLGCEFINGDDVIIINLDRIALEECKLAVHHTIAYNDDSSKNILKNNTIYN